MIDLNTDLSVGGLTKNRLILTTEKVLAEVNSLIDSVIELNPDGDISSVAKNPLSIALVNADV